MDPEMKKAIKEWRENMEQAQAMEFALVAEKQYKNARDVTKIRAEMKQQLKEYFKNEKDNAVE